jgi:aquaporin Z
MKKLVMECLGTFFFIATIALTKSPFAIASMLMAWLYIGGFVSGGHYNPAVTLAVALRNRISFDTAIRYMIAQIIGGFLAYAFVFYIKGSYVVPAPGANINLLQAGLVEILLAFVFCLVVLTVATTERYRGVSIFGFAIGFTVPALAAFGGPISGGLFNPAIAIGSHIFAAFQGMSIVWEQLGMYVIGALIGAALAAYAYDYFDIQHI